MEAEAEGPSEALLEPCADVGRAFQAEGIANAKCPSVWEEGNSSVGC